jgi:hypothetical protein
MGEAKLKQYSQQNFLREHPWCCYCGAPATTVDHCPPRALFENRRWPIGHDFPCCLSCNQAGRRSEQIAVALLRTSLRKATEDQIWQRTIQSLKVNRPEIIAEWREFSRNDQRRLFREKFGTEMGDALRRMQYGIIALGPHTVAAVEDLLLRLGQALFYKHMGRRCTGRVYVMRMDMLNAQGALESVLQIIPNLAQSVRGKVDLSDQFVYRYNLSYEHGILGAIVKVREQFGAMLAVMDEPHASAFAEMEAGKSMVSRICPP